MVTGEMTDRHDGLVADRDTRGVESGRLGASGSMAAADRIGRLVGAVLEDA
jgi:hypothetical protein